MKKFEGEINYMATVSNVDPQDFHNGVLEQIQNCGQLYVEIKYQTAIQLNGQVLHSAMIIGRVRRDVE